MARVDYVEYGGIPAHAKEMRNCGKLLNEEIVKAYKNVENMHNVWYGKRYNELVKAFNNMIVELNDMLKLTVTDIPYTLELIANNYSKADQGQNITTASEEPAKKIEQVELINDEGMRFITADVQKIQEEISVSFTKAKEEMDKIEANWRKIKWQSEAADIFETKFTKLKNNISASFENINNEFKRLMAQTQEDIAATEKANTVE